MRHKLFAAFAFVCATGIILLLVKSSSPERNRVVPALEQTRTVVGATPSGEFTGVKATAGLPPGLSLTNKLFRTAEVLWREPVPEEAFTRFKAWTQRYLAADSASQSSLIPEGIELAAARRLTLSSRRVTNDRCAS